MGPCCGFRVRLSRQIYCGLEKSRILSTWSEPQHSRCFNSTIARIGILILKWRRKRHLKHSFGTTKIWFFSLSARILGNLTDAEDITQEVFIRAYERFPEIRNSSSI